MPQKGYKENVKLFHIERSSQISNFKIVSINLLYWHVRTKLNLNKLFFAEAQTCCIPREWNSIVHTSSEHAWASIYHIQSVCWRKFMWI